MREKNINNIDLENFVQIYFHKYIYFLYFYFLKLINYINYMYVYVLTNVLTHNA